MFIRALAIATALTVSTSAKAEDIKTAIFAGGCFWCVESDFESVDGVIEAISGYTGGSTADPTYKQVSKGGTGHFEAVKITYDADIVSYARLLHLFFRSVDPTDAGGQFCDRGQVYSTAIFFMDDNERKLALRAKASARSKLKENIATKLIAAGEFYEAEEYHQDYYKSSDRVLTRFGWVQKQDAYKRYRKGCGRDKRVKQLWGRDAPFAS